MENERLHVTVVGEHRRVDLAVPAGAAIAEYTPTLLRLVGQVQPDDAFPPVWSLALPGVPPFPPETSLRDEGVVDGATLYLRDAAAGEFDEPVVSDLEESVDQSDDGVSWGVRARAYTTLTLGILGLVACFVTLAWSWGGRPLVGCGAVFVGFCTLLLGWQATRQGWSLPLALRLLMVWSVVPLFAVAAVCLPAFTGGGARLVAAATGSLLGAVAAVVALRHVTTLITAAISGTSLVLVVWLVIARATPVEWAAVVGVASLAVLGIAPKLSGHFAVLAGKPNTVYGEVDPEAEVAHLVQRGRRLLIGINVLCSATSVYSLVVLAVSDQPFAMPLAGCMGLALVLRAGQLTIVAAVVPVVFAGVVGIAAALAFAPARFGAPAWTGLFGLVICAVVAVAMGLGRAFREDVAEERPSWLDGLSAFLLLATVPLAVGVFGVYTALMNSGGTS